MRRVDDTQGLRVTVGLLFHPRSPFAVSYTVYTARLTRVLGRLARVAGQTPFHRSFDEHVVALNRLYGEPAHALGPV